MVHKSNLQNCAKEKLEIKNEIETDQCIICKEEFGTFELEIHAINCKGEEKVDVENNDTKPFQSPKLPKNNELNERKRFEPCAKSFKSIQSLKSHQKRIHDKLKDEKCVFCDKDFASKTELTIHIRKFHHETKNMICKVCNKAFATMAELNTHVKSVHAEHTKVVCKYCQKSLKKKYLKRHLSDFHENINNYICKNCDRVFIQKPSLMVHIRRVHMKQENQNEKTYCESCDKNMSSPQSLRSHNKRIHDITKDVKCQFCNKAFASRSLVKVHVRTVHEKVKAYICNQCDKAFGQS